VGQAGAKEGANVGAAVDDCRRGKVRVGADFRLCGGGDAAQRGEISGAPTVALMKGSWRLRQRGTGTGAAATMTAKGYWHGGGDDDDRSQRPQCLLQSLPWWSSGGSVRGKRNFIK
jgi:hypothetical protein